MQHPNPKIRYAALHCIGQLADDMPNDFQKAFHGDIMPALVATLDDQVPRVQSHTCACLTNFCEHIPKDALNPHMQDLSSKFCMLIKDGISMIKENAATALGTIVEKIGEDFKPFFEETIQFLISYIGEFHTPAYK